MQDTNATAGPSKYPIKPRQPFVAAENRPESPDGIFRVIIISSGSVASVKIPEIVGTLSGVRHSNLGSDGSQTADKRCRRLTEMDVGSKDIDPSRGYPRFTPFLLSTKS